MRCVIRRWARDEKGAAVLETGIVAPFLVVLGLGTFEFGNAFYHYHLISTGLHDAARYLARTDDPIGKQVCGKQLAVYGKMSPPESAAADCPSLSATKRVSWWRVEDVTVTLVSYANPVDVNTGNSAYRGGATINVVKVATNVSDPGFGFFTAIGLKKPIQINVFHEERHIGD